MNTLTFNTQICDSRSMLMRLALKYTRNREDADDLVQETLMKAIRYEDKYQEGTNLEGWLFTIMRNTFINNYKVLGRKAAIFISNVDPWSYPVTDSTTKNHGEGNMISEDISKALINLQPEYALPFLRYFEGYKYHEIAKEMDLPLGTVKTRIHLARKALKSTLKMYA